MCVFLFVLLHILLNHKTRFFYFTLNQFSMVPKTFYSFGLFLVDIKGIILLWLSSVPYQLKKLWKLSCCYPNPALFLVTLRITIENLAFHDVLKSSWCSLTFSNRAVKFYHDLPFCENTDSTNNRLPSQVQFAKNDLIINWLTNPTSAYANWISFGSNLTILKIRWERKKIRTCLPWN